MVAVDPAQVADLELRAKSAFVPCMRLGATITQPMLRILDGDRQLLIEAPLAKLRDARDRCLEPIVGK